MLQFLGDLQIADVDALGLKSAKSSRLKRIVEELKVIAIVS